MRKLILILLIFFLGAAEASSQSLDFSKYKNTDISRLPESQIKQMADEAKKRNYTLSQITQIARANGASDTQVQALERRLRTYMSGTVKKTQTRAGQQNNLKQTDFTVLETSAKGLFTATHADSLIFGFTLFNNESLTFEPSLTLPVPETYLLAAGDEILIDIWGLSQQSYNLEVSSAGSVDIPIAGPVYVAGKPLSQARREIEARLKTIYSDLGSRTSASIRTGKLRTITVNVIGEVFAPGTYTVSGAASLFNVLYLSGGPNRNGSFRNVQLIRSGKIIAELDVYDFLLNGKSTVNIPLLDNDIVMIPTYQKRIAVGGEFKRIGYFEAKEGETIDDIIRYAGGFTPQALQEHIGIYRVGKYGMEYKEIDPKEKTLLANGDSVCVQKIDPTRITNIVHITGGVLAPGSYEFHDGLTLNKLIEKAGGLHENAFVNRGVLMRTKDDYTRQSINFNVAELISGQKDIDLKAKDSVVITRIDDMRDYRFLTVNGAVRQPGYYGFSEGLTIADLLLLAGGITETASTNNVQIIRRLSNEVADTSTSVSGEDIYISITKELAFGEKDNSFELKPFDRITVRELPSAKYSGTVNVLGEVKYPGEYSIVKKDDDILSIIERAGGITDIANVSGARLYRRVTLSEKEELIKKQKLAVQVTDTAQLRRMLEEQDDTYELVAIDLEKVLNSKKNKKTQIWLQDGDEIVVPQRSQTVRVSGQVLNPVSMLYVEGYNAKDFIMKSGGFSPNAKKKKTFVINPDGSAVATKHFLFFRKFPNVVAGSEVVVPEKPERNPMGLGGIVSISSSLVTMAAVIISLL